MVGANRLRPTEDQQEETMSANLSSPGFSKRIPQLDGLQGAAIAMVVAFHYVVNPDHT